MGGAASSSSSSSAEVEIFTDRFKQKLNEVDKAAQSQLSPVQDHVIFTLQKECFRCAYECIDRSKKLDEINDCVDHCNVPVCQAKDLVDSEMAKFKGQLNLALIVCEDKFKNTKQYRSDLFRDFESCQDQAIQDSLKTLPPLIERLKNDLSVPQ